MANRNAVKGIGAAIAAGMLFAIPFITDREGESLESYRDVVGVWTICNGETLGVKPGQKMTGEGCRALTQSRVGQFMQSVAIRNVNGLPPETLAAHTSFAYNIGIAGYTGSRTLRETNMGNLKAGCEAMMGWHTAGGRDCRVRANNCYGLIKRREDEIKLCLSGL